MTPSVPLRGRRHESAVAHPDRYALMKIENIIPLLFVIGTCIASAQTNSTTNATVHANRANIYDDVTERSKPAMS